MPNKIHKLKGGISIQEYSNRSFGYLDPDTGKWRNIPSSLAKNLIKQLVIKSGSDRKSSYLQNSKGEFRYVFNWVGGGFNDEWAKTKAEAIKKAESRCSLIVNRSTCRRVTKQQSDRWDRDAILATC